MKPHFLSCSLMLVTATSVLADGPTDNIPGTVRPIPPPGLEIPADVQQRLTAGLDQLAKAIQAAQTAQAKNASALELLPDVEVYYKAVEWALRHKEFHKDREFKVADELLAEGMARAGQLKEGRAPWTKAKGSVVRAYRSKIDGSVQPYGMTIPDSYVGAPMRLDTWFHGRGETLSELAFIDGIRKGGLKIAPKDTLVIQPYGRYSNANKFAGEIDLLEALDHAERGYRIDPDRIIVRGFSMGGAACWQFAVHYADRWCAASPGAGFSETPEFLLGFQGEDVYGQPWYQQKLWHWYNATDHALNLFHCPTVAYSGEIDKQKQAADAMETAMRAENFDMRHIIGPQTAHKIHPDSLVEIEQRLADIAAVGRDATPTDVHLATWTLRYNRMHWVVVDALEEHWGRARVHARVTGDAEVTVNLQNVTALSFEMPSGHCPLTPLLQPVIKIAGQELKVRRPKIDRSWMVHLRKIGENWQEVIDPFEDEGLHKKHLLQGPVDDAFMDRFVFVRPTGPAWNAKADAWAKSEMDRAIFEWRRQFRGDAVVKKDTELTEDDIANANLVLWGDPGSNAVLAKVLADLPIQWTKDKLTANGQSHDASGHAPILIYPNPLNPERYVVLNSGFTYREYDYLNNARQVPKLPDWAVIDLSIPPDTQKPGGVKDAGFFGERWEWK